MSETSRQQRVVERILEDERLRGDLEDTAAKALLAWATKRAGSIAADPTRSDEQVDAATQAVRRATLRAAESGESDPARVVELAEAALPALPAPSPAQLNASQESAQPKPPAATGLAASAARLAGAGARQPASTAPIERALPRRRRNRLARLIKQLRGGS